MPEALVVHQPLDLGAVAQELEGLNQRAVDFEHASLSPNTREAYRRIWPRFERWCTRRGLCALPASPDTVRLYATAAVEVGIEHQDGTPASKPLGVRSLTVHLATIAFVHGMLDHPNPVEDLPKRFRKGLRRAKGKPPVKKTWLSTAQILETLVDLRTDLKGIRDRAILLVAFGSGGRRRSEMTEMAREDLRRLDGGAWLWTIPKSKTDQEGEGFRVVIPKLPDEAVCPASALSAWLAASGIEAGPVFRYVDRHGNVRGGVGAQPRVVAEVVKAAVRRLGLDPKEYAGHSLRSGFATSMAKEGLRVEDIMKKTGHTSLRTVMGYIHEGQALAEDDPVKSALGRGWARRQTDDG